jgi:hypothetical protein
MAVLVCEVHHISNEYVIPFTILSLHSFLKDIFENPTNDIDK